MNEGIFRLNVSSCPFHGVVVALMTASKSSIPSPIAISAALPTSWVILSRCANEGVLYGRICEHGKSHCDASSSPPRPWMKRLVAPCLRMEPKIALPWLDGSTPRHGGRNMLRGVFVIAHDCNVVMSLSQLLLEGRSMRHVISRSAQAKPSVCISGG